MLKIIHTADWHLGQTFFGYDRRMEHLDFLNWLRREVGICQADVLLVSGDVFDSPNPSAESQKLYYRFLHDITRENPQLQLVIIAGNHDSAARLEAPSPLLESMNIVVRGVIRRRSDGSIDTDHLIVPLRKEGDIAAYCLAVPYLRQGDYPQADSYAEGVQSFYTELIEQALPLGKPLVAMGHLQATGSELSVDDRSERTVVGGLEAVSPQVFDGKVEYVALGHLHRAQQVSGRELVRYAGAPLPMSFAEKHYRQGVMLVTLDEDGREPAVVERRLYEPPVSLWSLPTEEAEIEGVLEAIAGLPEGEPDDSSPYLEIKAKVTQPDPTLKYKIQEALKGKQVRLARIVAVAPPKAESSRRLTTYEEVQQLRPIDIALDFYKQKYGGSEMPDALQQVHQRRFVNPHLEVSCQPPRVSPGDGFAEGVHGLSQEGLVFLPPEKHGDLFLSAHACEHVGVFLRLFVKRHECRDVFIIMHAGCRYAAKNQQRARDDGGCRAVPA